MVIINDGCPLTAGLLPSARCALLGETSLSHNATLQDILWTLLTVPVFAIFFIPPGYILGWATDLLGFNSRSATEKLLLSLPLSLVISTVLTNIVGRYIASRFVLACFVMLAAWILSLIIMHRRAWTTWIAQLKSSRPTVICFTMAPVWACVVIGSVVDVEIGARLYPSTTIWDHGVRIAFIHSALRSGVPPANPFCYLGGHAPAARYYYYWNVLCSYPARLTHIDPRYILYASSIWAGFCLAALVPIYLKHFLGVVKNLERKSMFGILLLCVTGFDILPNLYERFRGHRVYPDIEWWDPVQITAWHDALIWVPHHVAALTAFFIGFLVLWSVREGAAERLSIAGGAVVTGFTACAFAAGAGLSVYVAFTFAIFLAIWAIRLLLHRRFRDVLLYVATACVTIFISLPYLHDLLPRSASGARGISTSAGGVVHSVRFVAFGIRALPGFLSTPAFLEHHGFHHPGLLIPVGLIVVYVLEFGFFAIVGWDRLWRDSRLRRTMDESEIACWYLIALSMFVITFLRSAVITNNDLAYRSAMIVQFVLLLWGADYLDALLPERRSDVSKILWQRKNAAIACSLLLGIASTVYSLFILRSYTALDDHGKIPDPAAWLPPPHQVGDKIFAVRALYTELRESLPTNAVVQYNPMSADFLLFLIYDPFQSVDAFPDCGTAFGGNTAKCIPAQEKLAALFEGGPAEDMFAVCDDLSIDVLVAQNTDPAWHDKTSWIWKNIPIAANSFARAFRCK